MLMNKEERQSALEYLSNIGAKSEFDNPFDDKVEVITPNPKLKQEKEKKDKFDKILEETEELTSGIIKDEKSYKFFDEYLEQMFENEEDTNLKNSLISMGRKYSRGSTAEENELTKAYNARKVIISNLISDIDRDSDALQKDIDKHRSYRTQSPKFLADMAGVKAQYHTLKLNALKEINSMDKISYEINMKENKNAADVGDSSAQITKALQSIMGLNQSGDLINNVGGRATLVGDTTDEINYERTVMSEEEIHRKYIGDREETESDKYIKYKDSGAHFILDIGANGSKKIHAEDSTGNVLDDFPIPKNIGVLNFKVNEDTGSASDQYNRHYDIRHSEVE
jgi:hypothetical protein